MAVIGFRVNLFPDEMLFSAVARHGKILGITDARGLSQVFFGSRSSYRSEISVDRLAGFESTAPLLGYSGGEHVLSNHTNFYYNSAFISDQRRQVEKARFLSGLTMGSKVNAISNKFAMVDYLSFCDSCVQEANCGDSFPWLRLHQLPGVFVCPTHKKALRRSSVVSSYRRGKFAYQILDQNVIDRSGAPPQFSKPQMSVLVRFAASAALLLRNETWLNGRELQTRLAQMIRNSYGVKMIRKYQLSAHIMASPRIIPLVYAANISPVEFKWQRAFDQLLFGNPINVHPLLVLILIESCGGSLADIRHVGNRKKSNHYAVK